MTLRACGLLACHAFFRPVPLQAGPLHKRSSRLVHLRIDRQSLARKRYLGAYRHKLTGATYEHATSQTPADPSAAPAAGSARGKGSAGDAPGKLTQQVQTAVLRTRATQSVRECGTQMPRPGLLLDTSRDCEVAVGNYVTAEEFSTCGPGCI